MTGLRYTLVLQEPLLANSRAGDTNSARSFLHVPGGLIRGALIHAYLSDRGLAQGDVGDSEFQRLFLSEHTRYLHAYPGNEEIRTLPVPLAWKITKDESYGNDGEAFNLAVQDETDEPDLEPFPATLWWQQDQDAYACEIDLQFNLHTQRDALYGRAKEGRGAVFRFEPLPTGQCLQGVILTATERDATILKTLLEGRELLLGKARTAGYGRARIEQVIELTTDWREGWHWRQKQRTDADEDDELDDFSDETPKFLTEFTLTFVSAALVRNAHGQFTLDPLHALKSYLKEVELQLKGVFRQVEIVGGFNRTWGLPLPQVPAIAPGSVFRFAVNPEVPFTVLQALETRGLGERRNEGYGRIVIDHYQPAKVRWRKLGSPDKAKDDEKDIQLNQAAMATARLMLTRLLRQELEEKCLETVQRLVPSGTGNDSDFRVSNSQLNRWRVLLRDMQGRGKPVTKLQRLFAFQQAEQRRGHSSWAMLERIRLGNSQCLTEWIEGLLTGVHAPWQQLGYGEATPSKQLTGIDPVETDDEWAMEYTLRLLDTVLGALAKRNVAQRKFGGSRG